MPPSPAMRCSLGREPRADNHKRGRSLESGIPSKQRDDDLALFNEVQSKEKDNFLLQADDDDFEHIFPNKLRYFSDYKLGINIPARGESSDLLHAEEEKNDYEWLLTPPDTPLFASLDDEAPQVIVAQRGRAQTQPISISRSSTMEKSRRSSRGSASPNRVSLSPRSHNSPFEGGAQSPSAPMASPPTSLRPTAASIRSPPPSRKPVPRASTSAPRRLSTGSNGNMNTRGISPVKTNRGNSASPKIRAWQSNIPGFSTDVPPNLRTSLADRPASYVRGSSLASRNSRQSMSPTASRSISSSHSHERDIFSSHSKGSVASSAEDDMESLSSVLVGSAQRSDARKVGGFQNNSNKASPSKKQSRAVSSSSAPKRSFDLALRHMDQKKGPQNMFRQLLSSVPSSTFHAGITTSPHHTMISRNSSVTTSSNASSGLGISGAHDPEASQDDTTSERVNVQDCDVDDEVFVIEKDDGVNNEYRGVLDNSRNLGDRDPATSVAFDDISGINSQKGMLICSRCGCGYYPIEKNVKLCADCVELYSPLTGIDPVVSGSETEVATIVEPRMALVKARSGQHDDLALVKDGGHQSTYGEPIWNFLSESSLSRSRSEDCESKVDFSNPKVGSSEGAGISILLKRSSSIKGAVLRNTNFSASSISYDDLSYVRNSTNSMRSVSASSSVDLGPARFQRQSSSTKSETENYKFDGNGKHQRSGSSLSGTSSHAFHPSSLGTSTLDSLARDVQENNVENDTGFENVDNNDFHAGPEQTRVDSGESLVTHSQKVEDVGPNDATALRTGASDNETGRNPCVDSMDVAEVLLDPISEGEFDKTCGSSPASECDVSISSASSIEELREDVAVSGEDFDTSNHANGIIEESIVLVGHEGGLKGRSLTLEEATDTILFCSSIVHKLALNAAAIAIEKENPSADNGSWPLIPATRKTDLDRTERNPTKRSSKSQKSRQKKEAETNTAEAPNATETEGKTDQLKTRIVGVRDSSNGESKKPPLLESKCNCTIM